MSGGEKNDYELAEEMLNEADSDISADDLTRGTEVYEEIDEEAEAESDDYGVRELDFEPEADYRSHFDYDQVSDAHISEDDY
jgi:hypothetical protein